MIWDSFGRILECPKCGSTDIAESKRHDLIMICVSCTFRASVKEFRAVPEDAARYNPTRRYS